MVSKSVKRFYAVHFIEESISSTTLILLKFSVFFHSAKKNYLTTMDIRKRRKGSHSKVEDQEPLISHTGEDHDYKAYKPSRTAAEADRDLHSVGIRAGGGTLTSYSFQYISEFASSFWSYVTFFLE
jgi:hypothetical protein